MAQAPPPQQSMAPQQPPPQQQQQQQQQQHQMHGGDPNMHRLPIRAYLDQTVVPILLDGKSDLNKRTLYFMTGENGSHSQFSRFLVLSFASFSLPG